MARQRQLRPVKARRTKPIVRRGSVRALRARQMERLASYSDPSRMTDAQVEARNRAMAAALGKSDDRASLASYSAAAHRHSKALARKARKPRRATTMKGPKRKTTGKRRSAWVYVKAHRRRRPK